MQTRLTDSTVEKIRPPPSGRTEIGDALVRGLILRVTDQGRKSWSVIYRIAGEGDRGHRGKPRRLTLGVHPVVSVDAARERAGEALKLADKGINPASQYRTEAQTRTQRAFEVVARRFVDLYARPNIDTWRRTERVLFTYVVPKWSGRQIEDMDRASVHELLDELLQDEPPSVATEVRKQLSRMFNWAVDRGMMPASPVAGMRRPELAYRARERVLSMEELRTIWDNAGALGYPFAEFIRLLILTGQRRSEIAGLRRAWLRPDLVAVEVPSEAYKTRRPHVFPLSTPALAIVKGLPHWNAGDYMLSTTGGQRPISGFSKSKAELEDKCGVEDWRLHDLRRSAATHMARLRVPQEYIERVLGHAIEGVAGTYNRYTYLEEKREALELWGKQWI